MGPGVIVKPDTEFRGAPVMIIVSGDAKIDISRADCVLATGNMYIAAASFGIMSGWSHMTTKDLFSDPEVKKQFKIPEGYEVYSASFSGYPLGKAKDRPPPPEGRHRHCPVTPQKKARVRRCFHPPPGAGPPIWKKMPQGFKTGHSRVIFIIYQYVDKTLSGITRWHPP
jgi:hypothetical protein